MTRSIADNLRAALDAAGMTDQEASLKAGLGRTAVNDIVSGRVLNPRYGTMSRIAQALGTTAEALYGGHRPEDAVQTIDPFAGGGLTLSNPPYPDSKGRAPEYARFLQAGPKDLPILGEARGGADGVFLHNGDTLAYAERPPSLVGVRQAYAVIMRGTSMEPRYYDGDLLQVHPLKPVHAMNFVHFEMRDGQSFVKQYLRRDDQWVTVRQLNPEATIKIKSTEIKWLRRITGSTDDW